MLKFLFPLAIAFGLSLVTVFGDLMVKEASLHQHFAGWRWLLLGAFIYALTAFGWFYLMRRAELSILGAVYSITCVVALFIIGVFVYKDRVSPLEVVGLVMGVTSLVILFRFG